MKITTLNLWGRNNWAAREEAIHDYLQDENPEVVFFQEVVFLPEESIYTQSAELNKKLGYAFEQEAITRLQTSDIYEDYREGLAVLSRHPILKSETLVLKQDPSDHLQRIVQLLDIQIDGQIIKFANVHFGELPHHAEKHLHELLDILNRRHEQRIIIGDFNISYLDILDSIWQRRYNASTAVPYISDPGRKSRIDYILVPKPDIFANITLSKDTLSDHRALTAEIRF